MSSRVNSVEFKVKAALSLIVLCLLTLIGLLTHAWGWSTLAVITAIVGLSYPLCWLAWKAWRFWASSLMRLTTYTQSLVMGESAVLLAQQGKSQLIDDLSREIDLLNQKASGNAFHSQSLSV